MSFWDSATAYQDYASLLADAHAHANDASWPPQDADGDGEADLAYLGSAARDAAFGPLEWKPKEGSDSAIVITNDFKSKLKTILVPQLVGVDCYGTAMSGKVTLHEAACDALLAAFQEVEDAGLLHLVKTWGGTFSPRRIRGKTTLSNHAYGLAFDMNMAWNGLGAVPALVSEEGSVRAMVPLFNKHGFYWGGHYRSRLDGMHFEYVRS